MKYRAERPLGVSAEPTPTTLRRRVLLPAEAVDSLFDRSGLTRADHDARDDAFEQLLDDPGLV